MTLIAALLFFLLPVIAGGAVDRLRPGAQWLRLLLSFSGAFLVGIVFLHMLPELYEEEGEAVGAWVLAGFLLQIILEFFSRGIEHGHLHSISGRTVPLVTLLSLCIHAFVEGMPFADPAVAGNLPFLGGVLLHKMPMAIALGSVIQRSGIDRSKGLLLLLVFALAAPLGVAVGHFVGEGLGEAFLHSMLGVAIGMLLHIGTTIIFESAPEHRMDKARFAAVLIGVALAALTAH